MYHAQSERGFSLILSLCVAIHFFHPKTVTVVANKTRHYSQSTFPKIVACDLANANFVIAKHMNWLDFHHNDRTDLLCFKRRRLG